MKYCSLDLELTGFDPLTDEILEIGLVFFEPTPQGLRTTNKFSQIFRPQGQVHPKILGLTGLTQTELDKAPLLAQFHQVIQEQLNDSIVVGHNIILDAKFLEAFGFKLSGQFIDTLDLAQVFLPTHHSYNLENLMHYFGIAHEEAHRALADSLAVIALLESLIGRFQTFPLELQTPIKQLADQQSFLWQRLLDTPVSSDSNSTQPVRLSDSQETNPVTHHTLSDPIESGQVLLDNFAHTSPQVVAATLQPTSSQFLLVLPDKASVLALWQQGLAHGLFKPEDRFNSQKFSAFLQQATFTAEQTLFALKILVWLHTNWQNETIIDLNLSFFGGQFRYLINDLPVTAPDTSLAVACDYETFALLSEQKLLIDRVPVLWTAHNLEQWLGQGSQSRLTWNQTLYFLRTIYNPETNFGRTDLKNEVMAALAATDLFFGLVNLMVSRHFAGWKYITYESLVESEVVFNKIHNAAESLISKIEAVSSKDSFPDLVKLIYKLRNFFLSTPDHIKWIETAETNCLFVDQPLHIAPQLEEMLHFYPAPVVIENFSDHKLLSYTLRRLGLSSLEVKASQSNDHNFKVPIAITNNTPREEDILALIQTPTLPLVVLLPNKAEVRSFYDKHYSHLKTLGTVWAESYSGGSNKILRNFTIKRQSILLATPKFITRNDKQVAARTLIITALPTVEADHPYVKALQDFWLADFPDFLQLQMARQFYLLLQAFSLPDLKRILVYASPTDLEPVLSNLPDLELIP